MQRPLSTGTSRNLTAQLQRAANSVSDPERNCACIPHLQARQGWAISFSHTALAKTKPRVCSLTVSAALSGSNLDIVQSCQNVKEELLA